MSMIFCHGCSKEIHETAVSCPHCGAPQSSASSDLGKKNGTARKPVWGKVLIVIFALLAFSIGKSVYQGYKEREAEVMAGKTLPTAPPAQISPTGDLAAMFNLMSSNTDLQRENKFKEIKGKIVEWTLPVYEISKDGNNYRVQTEPGYAVGTFVFITPRDDQDKAIIEGLKTGSRISFKGVISDVTMRHLEIKPAILFQPGSVKPVAIETQQPAAYQQSQAPTQITHAGLWREEWGEESWREMEIKPAPTGFDVQLIVFTAGCIGEIKGSGTLSGNTLTLMNNDDDQVCTITVKFAGNTAEVNEQNCSFYHGAACEFDGILKKVK